MRTNSNTARADLGIVGLGVMGSNLALNLNDHGYVVAVYNRTKAKIDSFLAEEAAGSSVVGAYSYEDLVSALSSPRKILLMVPAGPAVDGVIEALIPLLTEGDIILDGGNSLFTDTIARTRRIEEAGFRLIGAGISGGADGARNGPSIMPGGSASAWPEVRQILQSVAASVDGVPCCDWVGTDGAGHYLKMVHNGIEYGDMQVLAEAYDIMYRGLGMSHKELHEVFAAWDRGPLDSYLVEITADVMASRDDDGEALLEKVLDTAGQKGTGKWTVASSMDLGQPTTLVAGAVYARFVSAMLERRQRAANHLSGPDPAIPDDPESVVSDLHDAVYASKIVAYAQGFMLLDSAAEEYGWDLNFAAIAAMWRGGCIIRSRFLGELMRVFSGHPSEPDILISDVFGEALERAQRGWRRTVARATHSGIPVPAYAAALAFFDAYRACRVPASLIQAQRDYFGSHMFERVDRPRGEWFTGGWHRSPWSED